MENNIVKVCLWGQTVGEIYWDERRKQSCFSFSKDFVSKGIDIAPLTASIYNPLLAQGEVYLGNKKELYKGLPEFLADSLPDNWGERVMKHWFDHYGTKRHLTPVDALSLMGKRSMGAFEFEPYIEKWEKATDIQLTDLYKLADAIMEESVLPDGEDALINLQKLFSVGTSAGGKRPKAIIAIDKETGEVKAGHGQLPANYTHYILKFNERQSFPTTLLEKTYYDMAVRAGIEMMPSALMEIDGLPNFITQRFDRGEDKIHTQTLAAMIPDADSYEDLFKVARKLGVPYIEQERLFRQAVFNVLGDNLDDHSKNFSFMKKKTGEWHMTPAYDLCFTYDLTGMGYANRHEMTLCGKDRDITREDLLRFGNENDIRKAKSLINDVADILMSFKEYALNNGVSSVYADVIQKALARNIGINYETKMVPRNDGNNEEENIFDSISILGNKGKYVISARYHGKDLPKERIIQEDYLAYSYKLATKQQLANKYLGERAKRINDKEFIVKVAVSLTNATYPQEVLSEEVIKKIRDFFSVYKSIEEKENALNKIWQEAEKLPETNKAGKWLSDAKEVLHEIAVDDDGPKRSPGLKV